MATESLDRGELTPQWKFDGKSASLVGGVLNPGLIYDHKNYGSKDVYYKGERTFERRFKVTNSFGKTLFDSGPIKLTVNYPGRVNSQWVVPEGSQASIGFHGSKSCREDFFSGRLKPGESTVLPTIAAYVPFAPPPANATVNGKLCSPGPSAPLLQNPVLSSAEISSVRRIRASLDAAGEMVNPGLLSFLGVAGEGESATSSDASLWALIVASGCPGNRAGCPDFLALPAGRVLHLRTGVQLSLWCSKLEEILVLRTTSCTDTLKLVGGWTFTSADLQRADVLATCGSTISGRDTALVTRENCERLYSAASLDEVFGILVDPFDLHLESLQRDIRVVMGRGVVGRFCHQVRSLSKRKRLLNSDRANCRGVLPAT